MEIVYNKEQRKKLLEKSKNKNLSKSISYIITGLLISIFMKVKEPQNLLVFYISIISVILALLLFVIAFDNFISYYLISSNKYLVERKKIIEIKKSKKENNKNCKIKLEGDKKFYNVSLGNLKIKNEVDIIYSKNKKDILMIIKKI